MFDNVLSAADPGDNARGGVACPSWLFLLDRLDPGRVLSIGTMAPSERRWLAAHATELKLIATPSLFTKAADDGDLPAAHFDVVHLCHDAVTVLDNDRALAGLRASTAPDAQVWASAAGRGSADGRLRAAGFERMRWILPVTSPKR